MIVKTLKIHLSTVYHRLFAMFSFVKIFLSISLFHHFCLNQNTVMECFVCDFQMFLIVIFREF